MPASAGECLIIRAPRARKFVRKFTLFGGVDDWFWQGGAARPPDSLKTDWQLHAYCLINNHFYRVMKHPPADLVTGLRWFAIP
jgi:hypothetical protein